MTPLARCLLIGIFTTSPLAAQAISVRTISDFGGAQDNPAEEMLRVSSVVRTDDGRYVVANGKPLEVRLYDRAGQLVRRLGRAGEGPGEFRNQAMVRHWPGDSVLTFSSGSRRWMLFSLDGKLVREWPLGDNEASPSGVGLFGGAFVQNHFGNGASCRAPLIRTLAPVGGPAHEAMVDGAGRVWLRRVETDNWTIHDARGTVVGSLVLRRFTPMELRDGHLVGIQLDADDFPHVVTLGVGLPQETASLGNCPPNDADGTRGGEIRSTLRNAMTAAEMHYAQHARYPRSLRDVSSMLKLPNGIEAQFEGTDDGNGYAISAWDVATGFRCMISVGYALRNYPEGTIGCGR